MNIAIEVMPPALAMDHDSANDVNEAHKSDNQSTPNHFQNHYVWSTYQTAEQINHHRISHRTANKHNFQPKCQFDQIPINMT